MNMQELARLGILLAQYSREWYHTIEREEAIQVILDDIVILRAMSDDDRELAAQHQ